MMYPARGVWIGSDERVSSEVRGLYNILLRHGVNDCHHVPWLCPATVTGGSFWHLCTVGLHSNSNNRYLIHKLK